MNKATVNESTDLTSENPSAKDTKQTSHGRRLGRLLWRWSKRFFWLLLITLVLLFAYLFFVFSSTAGLKHALNLVERLSTYQINAEQITGDLLDGATLSEVNLTGPELNVEAKTIALSLPIQQLIKRQLSIDALILKDADVYLQLANASSDSQSDAPSSQSNSQLLSDFSLPIRLALEKLSLQNVSFYTHDQQNAVFVIDSFDLALSFEKQIGQISTFELNSPDLQVGLTGQIETAGDYPVTLNQQIIYQDFWSNVSSSQPSDQSNSGETNLADVENTLKMTIEGNLKKALSITIDHDGAIDGQLKGRFRELFTQPMFDTNLALTKIDGNRFGYEDMQASGELTLSGAFDSGWQVSGDGKANMQLPELGSVVLPFDVELTNKAIAQANWVIELQSTQQSIHGRSRFNLGEQTFDVALRSDELQWPILETPVIAANSISITGTGSVNNYSVEGAWTLKKELESSVNQAKGDEDSQTANDASQLIIPMTLKATGNQTGIDALTLVANHKDEQIEAVGEMQFAPELRYDLQVLSDQLTNLGHLPNIYSLLATVKGQGQRYVSTGFLQTAQSQALEDTLSNEAMYGQIQWEVSGDVTQLEKANLQLHNVAQLTEKSELSTNNDNLEISNSALAASSISKNQKALGQLVIDATGSLSPVNIDLSLTAQQFNPATFAPTPAAPKLLAVIDSNITSHLRQKDIDSAIDVLTEIDGLNGQWQQYALKGQGEIAYLGQSGQLTANQVMLSLGENSLELDGQFLPPNAADSDKSENDLALRFDFPELKRLLPELEGTLNGALQISGQTQAPTVQYEMMGRSLAYAGNQLASVALNGELDWQSQVILTEIKAENIDINEQQINHVHGAIEGELSNHAITLDIAGEQQSMGAQFNGGLNINALIWDGRLNNFWLQEPTLGRWQTKQSSEWLLSQTSQVIKAFCLHQLPAENAGIANAPNTTASICLDADFSQGNQGEALLTLTDLPTALFAQWLPPSVSLDTTLSGKSNIQINQGTPTISGQIVANDGSVSLSLPTGQSTHEIAKFEQTFSLENSRFASTAEAELTEIGQANLTLTLPDIKQPDLDARLALDIPNLDFVAPFVPQLQGIAGNIKGDLRASGNPSETLAMAGDITLSQGQFNVPQYGTRIRDIEMKIFADDNQQIGFEGVLQSPEGAIRLNGSLSPVTQQGRITIAGDNFQLADTQKLQVALSPDLAIELADTIAIRGELLIPSALIVPETSSSKVTASEDVILPDEKTEDKEAQSPVDMDMLIRLGDDVRVASADIETRLQGEINVLAKPQTPVTATGAIAVETGEIRIYGQLLTIERGRVIFGNGPINNPALDISAFREIEAQDVIVGANILGTVNSPEISLTSTPNMADSTILSYLLFGRPPNSDAFGAMALLQTGGVVGTNTLARDIRSSIGLDVLDFSLTGFEAGKFFTEDIYLGVRSDFFSAINEFLLEYKINSRLTLEASSTGISSAGDIIYTIEKD